MRQVARMVAFLLLQAMLVCSGPASTDRGFRAEAGNSRPRGPSGENGPDQPDPAAAATSFPIRDRESILVISEPPEARIRLDGVPMAHRTPARIELNGPPRPRTLRLEKEGYTPWVATLSLARGEVRTVKAKMNGKGGYMQVHTEPWTIVFIDGKVAGATPLFTDEVAEGTYKVRMVNEEFGIDCVEDVSIQTGERRKMFKRFFGTLEISLLDGTETYLNGEALPGNGERISRKLPCGYHQVRRVSADDRSETLMNVLLREGERTHIP